LETKLKYRPVIKIINPGTLRKEAYRFSMEPSSRLLDCATGVITGERSFILNLEQHNLFEGCASATFDIPISPGEIRGEQSLYFHVKNRGIVCVTGCCHQTIVAFTDYARNTILGGENLYGLYGGLHICPTGSLTPEKGKMIQDMRQFGFRKIAVNHCTGLPAVERMLELGYPVVKGSGRFGSIRDLYVGNGDSVTFG
jgi:7,8-dihydropterin-6-yl-methyl-4-(beta-D-ribofuranosyl)aminobenzene 5'-phosphate synthase